MKVLVRLWVSTIESAINSPNRGNFLFFPCLSREFEFQRTVRSTVSYAESLFLGTLHLTKLVKDNASGVICNYVVAEKATFR